LGGVVIHLGTCPAPGENTDEPHQKADAQPRQPSIDEHHVLLSFNKHKNLLGQHFLHALAGPAASGVWSKRHAIVRIRAVAHPAP
jgi:hypothetical protein